MWKITLSNALIKCLFMQNSVISIGSPLCFTIMWQSSSSYMHILCIHYACTMLILSHFKSQHILMYCYKSVISFWQLVHSLAPLLISFCIASTSLCLNLYRSTCNIRRCTLHVIMENRSSRDKPWDKRIEMLMSKQNIIAKMFWRISFQRFSFNLFEMKDFIIKSLNCVNAFVFVCCILFCVFKNPYNW